MQAKRVRVAVNGYGVIGKRVADAALAAGKFAGTTAVPDTVEDILALGYRFVNVGADVLGLSTYCDDCVAAAKAARDRVVGGAG